MREYDTELIILQLVEILSKHVAKEKALEKRRTDARYTLDVALPASRNTRDDEEFDSLDLRVYGVDISYHGVGLLSDQPLAPSTRLRLSLQPLGLLGVSIICQVVYCRRLLDGVYRLGAEFVHQQVIVRDGKRFVRLADTA